MDFGNELFQSSLVAQHDFNKKIFIMTEYTVQLCKPPPYERLLMYGRFIYTYKFQFSAIV